MKRQLILLILVISFSSSITLAQSIINGRLKSSTPNFSLVNNQPKGHPLKVIDTGESSTKQLISENLYVTGRLGIGNDMVNNTTFGWASLMIMENNIQLLFDDTSSPGTYPSNDWAITINETVDAGDNCFMIEDITGLTTPFKIMAGASDSSFVMGSNGKIGLGTSTPKQVLHLNTGDTPALRLEQNIGGGWGAQTWDVAGNETNFIIRDVTNSNSLPFKIKSGAPSNSLTIISEGYVGIGTWTPSTHLDVIGNIRTDSTLLLNPLTEVPTSVEGGVYMDGNEHMLKVHNGTEWVSIDSDTQDLVDATLTGTVLQIDIENGASVSVDLQPLVQDLEDRIAALETLVSGKESVKFSSARLFQNAPNPYKNSTTISFFIPETVENAFLKITAVDGSLVKDIAIYSRGDGSVVIDGLDTGKGTYFYTLIVDGQQLESKTLVKVD